jgi:hypothetical protein
MEDPEYHELRAKAATTIQVTPKEQLVLYETCLIQRSCASGLLQMSQGQKTLAENAGETTNSV